MKTQDGRRSNKGPGRKKGVPNKTTASVKAALEEAFKKRGGVKSLLEWAETQPTEFYKLWAKLLPLTVEGELSVTVEVINSYGNENTNPI